MAEHAVTDTETLETTATSTPRISTLDHIDDTVPDPLGDVDEPISSTLPATETEAEQTDDDAPYDVVTGGESERAVTGPKSVVRLALTIGLVVVLGLAGLVAWLGFDDYKDSRVQQQQNLLIQVARQGALNLTTVDWQHAETDVNRILDSATGAFYEDFSQRSKPFIEVVKKAQSKSVGTITETGLESESGDEAQVLVALSVTTSSQGAADQEPRHWRMRITVRRDGGGAKVSNVVFVP